MSKTGEKTESIEKALTVFGQIIVDDRKELRADFRILTKSVNRLILAEVEARKEREHESERAERMEGNQKEQGQDIKNISENLLLQGGRIKDLEKKQDTKDKIKIGLFVLLGGAVILAVFKLIGPYL